MNLSKEELLADIKRLAEELDRPPKWSEYREKGEFSHEPFISRYGTWSHSLVEAGFEPFRRGTGESEPIDYGPNWGRQRKRLLERDGFVCQDCGLSNREHLKMNEQSLHVHHLTKRHRFDNYEEPNRLENLVTLCRSCHYEWEKYS
ncbi:homing endonuclease associated repeat-containing protein [Haladaptatus sp. DFWS20]|uniref:homing endonuclease associated repeat-containing protein n=1 Tax=Haladaptatus sp. DFWS20 TaxID=3403467 RepID=UPI003EBC1F21